jgi:hypothetical protein
MEAAGIEPAQHFDQNGVAAVNALGIPQTLMTILLCGCPSPQTPLQLAHRGSLCGTAREKRRHAQDAGEPEATPRET